MTASPRDAEGEHEPVVCRDTTACGVERWRVKPGIDGDARKVNTHNIVSTTIFHLRSLTPPGDLSAHNRSRITPTDTTVFRVSGTLLRVKQETDSDYHLVIADTGGRTMTASVKYSTGRPPRSFDGSAKTVGSSGVVSSSWHMESKGPGGTATVTCSYHGQSRSATASFSIG